MSVLPFSAKALYTVVFLLMQQMQKDLTCTRPKGINISFRISQSQEIASDKQRGILFAHVPQKVF